MAISLEDIKTGQTMTTYKLEKTATQLHLTSPYNPDFIASAKADLGAKWDGQCWCFDIRDEAAALKLVERYYGWKSGMPLVSVCVRFNEGRNYARSPCVLLGRVIASATGRDSGAKLGDGVRLQAGDGATSGGSAKNWTTIIAEGSEFIVHDVPMQMAQDHVDGKRQSRNVVVEVVSAAVPAASDPAALTQERAALVARIAEIDVLLN
jgi:hypothetical protein